jgi:hypothetical protein
MRRPVHKQLLARLETGTGTCLGEKNGEAGVRRVGVQQAAQQAARGRLEGCSARRRRHNHRTVLRRMRGLMEK